MSSDHTQQLRKRITQLEVQVQALRKQAQAQRQRIAQKCRYEFLAPVNSDCNCKVVVIDILQKLVIRDEEGISFLKLMGFWWAKLSG